MELCLQKVHMYVYISIYLYKGEDGIAQSPSTRFRIMINLSSSPAGYHPTARSGLPRRSQGDSFYTQPSPYYPSL